MSLGANSALPARSLADRILRRGPLEMAAALVIALGIAMMLQPFALVLYTWSFVTTLAGVALFTIVSKFPR